jgi:hypothetical protein
VFRDGIFSIPGYTAVTRSSFLRLWEQGILREGEDDCWVGYYASLPLIPWTDFWIRETETGQQVAQLHDRYMMIYSS